MSTAAGIVVARMTWAFLGARARHSVTFEHNTLSGSQRVFVDGAEFFKSGWKYRLTGTFFFALDGRTVEIYVRTNDFGELTYSLSVDAKEVPLLSGGAGGAGGAGSAGSGGASSPSRGGGGSSGAAGAGASPAAGLGLDGGAATPLDSSAWVVSLADGLHRVDFDHRLLEVFVDAQRVDAAGAFVEEGSAYTFSVGEGAAACACTLTALPLPAAERRAAGGRSMRTSLDVEGLGVVPLSERL